MSTLSLTLKTTATLKHVKQRKEGDEDDRELAADLKFHVEGLDASVLAQLLPTDAGHDPVTAFWDEDGHPRWFNIGEVSLAIRFDAHRIALAGRPQLPGSVHKFSFTVRDERAVDLTFSVQVHPQPSLFTMLAEYLLEDMTIAIEPAQQSLDLEPQAQSPLADDQTGVRLEHAGKTVFEGTAAEFSAATQRVAIIADVTPFVRETGKTSISAVQRHFKISYNEAARCIEALEAAGVVGPLQSDGKRVVLPTLPTVSDDWSGTDPAAP